MSVRITWAPSTDDDIAEYELQRAASQGGTYTTIATIEHDLEGANYSAGKFFYDDAGGSGTSWYRLRAIDAAEQASPWSAAFQPAGAETIGAIYRVQGQWNDGGVLADAGNAAVRLTMPVGGHARIELAVDTTSGVPYTAPSTFVLTARRKPQDGDKLFRLTATQQRALGKNVWTFDVTPSQTKNLEWGIYVFDVWGTRTADGVRQQVVKLSRLVLEASATPP